MKRYVYTNQKGGVTKTTTAISCAVMGALCQKRVLLVDMDGQGNSTWSLGYAPDAIEHTVYTAMRGESTIEQALKPTYFDPKTGRFFDPHQAGAMETLGLRTLEDARRGPDLLPNNILASSADIELVENPTWGILLQQLLLNLDRYDEIHIDTNPSLGKLTVNALYSATDVIIPMTPEAWSLQGMVQLARAVAQTQKSNRSLRVDGVVFTRVRYASHQQVMKQVREAILPDINHRYPGLTIDAFSSIINEGASFGEAINNRTNVTLAAPWSNFALQYWQLYLELLKRSGGLGLPMALQTYQGLYTRYQQEEQERQARKQARAATER